MARVLLIEPDRLLAGTYAEALTVAGHKVVACAGAQAAILAADQKRPDAIILELQLIEHSGLEFLYELRSYPEWQNIPVIIQSGVPPTEFSDGGSLLESELNVKTYLYKPRTSLRQLLKTVTEQLSVAA
jgi:DNA-binding response OmpR family regulator